MPYTLLVNDPERPHFEREYRISPTITFELLLRHVQQDLGFPLDEVMTFYLSNGNWERTLEISMIEVDPDEITPASVLPRERVGSLLSEVGERLILVYDLLQDRALRMEIVRVDPEGSGGMLAGQFECIHSVGVAPKVVDMVDSNRADLDELIARYSSSNGCD